MAKRRQYVVLGGNPDIAEAVVRKVDRLAGLGRRLAQAIDVQMLTLEVRHSQLKGKPVRDAIVQVKRIGLCDGSNFLVVI